MTVFSKMGLTYQLLIRFTFLVKIFTKFTIERIRTVSI